MLDTSSPRQGDMLAVESLFVLVAVESSSVAMEGPYRRSLHGWTDELLTRRTYVRTYSTATTYVRTYSTASI